MLITRWSCENLLKLSGWTVDKTNPPISNCVLIAAPHTSNWDFILMLLFAGAFGLKISWMGKKYSIYPTIWLHFAFNGGYFN
jgi:1-acyl-sn-glycerol-3-phosphate acyltransferase